MPSMKLPVTLATLAASLALTTPVLADDDGWDAVPVFRIALGPAIHVAPESEKQVELGLDLTAGAIMMPGGAEVLGLVIDPELGYAFDSLGVHAFNLTCGIGAGNPFFAFLYQPRLIAGTLDGTPAVGMRNSFMIHALADMGSLEIGHQFVSIDGALHHDIRVMFGVNPAAFFYVVAGIADVLR